jgi:hypothetical protein
LLLLGFCDYLTQQDQAQRSARTAHQGFEMMLLIFTAELRAGFRFDLNRHNYAT